MKTSVCKLAALVVLIGVASPASARTVLTPADHIGAQAFLTRAEALRAKGPMALFSSDLKHLQAMVEDNGDIIHDDLVAARAARAMPQYCPPTGHEYIGARELIEGLRAMPRGEREQIDLQTAMRKILAQLHPCGHDGAWRQPQAR